MEELSEFWGVKSKTVLQLQKRGRPKVQMLEGEITSRNPPHAATSLHLLQEGRKGLQTCKQLCEAVVLNQHANNV